MTREEAINFGEMWLDMNEDAQDSQTYAFFEQALEALKAEPCEDAVSKNSALKALCYACSIHQNGGKCSRCDGYNAISDLPPVTPKPTECEDAVSREAVLKAIEGKEYKFQVYEAIEKLPPVTPKQRTGKWIDDKCSVCGKGIQDLISSPEWYRNEEPKFCPYCGIKLEGESE